MRYVGPLFVFVKCPKFYLSKLVKNFFKIEVFSPFFVIKPYLPNKKKEKKKKTVPSKKKSHLSTNRFLSILKCKRNGKVASSGIIINHQTNGS